MFGTGYAIAFPSERRNSRGRTRTTSGTRVVAFNRLGESIADTLRKGDHVLVDGQLVSSKYGRENGKSKKAKAAKFVIFWSVRANSVLPLSRVEAEVSAQSPAPEPLRTTGRFEIGFNLRPSGFGRRVFFFVLIPSQF